MEGTPNTEALRQLPRIDDLLDHELLAVAEAG